LAAHPDKEITEVLYGNENIIKKTLETISWIEKTLEGCIDHTELAMHVTTQPIWDGLNQLKEKGVRLRLITDITNENIPYAKRMMEIADVCHLKGVRSSFGIADGIEYLDHAISDRDQLSHAIISNVKAIVEAKQYLFETLWNIASPAEQVIREIESGTEPTKTEIIHDTKVSISRSLPIIKSAKKEVLVIWATSKTFVIGMSMGVAEIYAYAVRNGARVKLLVPYGDRIEIIAKDLKMLVPQVDVRIADKSLETKITILIVDSKEVMTWELRDDSNENPYQAGGLATYSNNKSIASSYATIFETLWKQTDLYEQSQNFSKMQDEFINVAAHELRTPIQPILGLTENLLSRTNDIEQAKLLDVISRNAKRLHRLTEDILDVTKIESQSLHLRKERFNLTEILNSVIADSRNQIKKQYKDNIKLEFLSKEDIFVEADRSRVYQVILNLLSNAIKFTNEEGVIAVTAAVEEKDSHTVVVVSTKDNGQGIDREMLPRLFTKFATKSEAGGTGLGLFICKSIVEAHGGRIWAENNSNEKGAAFYFSLPLSR
jgi:two-component system, OmpR family, sensor histidine kinase VicK